MKTRTGHSLAALLLCSLALLATPACSDDKDGNPTPPGAGGKGNSGSGNRAGTKAEAGEGSPAGNTSGGGSGATAGEASAGTGHNGEGGSGGELPLPSCDLPELGEDGCFNCPQDADVEQWLNRCTDGDCLPFANTARLPLLEGDGSRPDLPN